VITDPQAKADLLAEFTRRMARQGADAQPARQPPGPRSQLLTAASKTTITRFTLEPALDRQAAPGDQDPETTRPGTSARPHQD
jgi:hypothetical protein